DLHDAPGVRIRVRTVADQAVLADRLLAALTIAGAIASAGDPERHVRSGIPPDVLPAARAGQLHRHGLAVGDGRRGQDPDRHVVEARLVQVRRLGQGPVGQPGAHAAYE